MSIIRFSLPECNVSVLSIDPKEALAATHTGTESPASIYLKAGESALIDAIEDAYGMKIDRYIGATETDFKSFINYFGGIEINVPEQVNYRDSEMSLVLIKGDQTLKGDTFFKYMLYLDSLGSEGKERQSVAMYHLLKGIFNPDNLRKRNKIFKQITNDMLTDISIVDFSSEEDGIVMLMENGITHVDIVDNPENF